MPISGLIHLLNKVSMALFDSLLWHLCHCMYSLCLYIIQVLYTSVIKLKKTCSDVTNAGNEEYFFSLCKLCIMTGCTKDDDVADIEYVAKHDDGSKHRDQVGNGHNTDKN